MLHRDAAPVTDDEAHLGCERETRVAIDNATSDPSANVLSSAETHQRHGQSRRAQQSREQEPWRNSLSHTCPLHLESLGDEHPEKATDTDGRVNPLTRHTGIARPAYGVVLILI